MTVQRSKRRSFLSLVFMTKYFESISYCYFESVSPFTKTFQDENQTQDNKKLQPKPGMQQQLQCGLAY